MKKEVFRVLKIFVEINVVIWGIHNIVFQNFFVSREIAVFSVFLRLQWRRQDFFGGYGPST